MDAYKIKYKIENKPWKEVPYLFGDIFLAGERLYVLAEFLEKKFVKKYSLKLLQINPGKIVLNSIRRK